MAKTNRFHIKKVKDNNITVEEERKYRSPLALFFIRNGVLIFCVSLLFSTTIFTIAIYSAMANVKESSVVKYESNGLLVNFDGSDSTIVNGIPITDDYAFKVFDSSIHVNNYNVGVVIKIKEIALSDRTIVFYSDNTALIKYKNGGYSKVSCVNGKYGVGEKGIIDSNATVLDVDGVIRDNKDLGISILYLSDGSMEVTKGNTVFFVRNSDATNNDKLFYTNLSGVSLPVSKDNYRVYYSDGTIKENNNLIVDTNRYSVREEKNIHNNIKIIYYENGYAEIIKDGLSVMVKKSDHIVYDNNTLEIVDNSIVEMDIKDIMDIKNITLNNTSTEALHYIIVLEETNNYKKYNVKKRLANEFIRFNIYANGEKHYNNILNNNLKNSNRLEGVSLNNNTYLLCEGSIDKLSSTSVKIGMWIDYDTITNEYMNSAFIGTVKVYVETLN